MGKWDKTETTITLIKQWEEQGGSGEGKQPLGGVPTLETQLLEANTDNVELLQCLVAQEHVESQHMRRSKTPLITKGYNFHSLLLNSIKLHLTAALNLFLILLYMYLVTARFSLFLKLLAMLYKCETTSQADLQCTMNYTFHLNSNCLEVSYIEGKKLLDQDNVKNNY